MLDGQPEAVGHAGRLALVAANVYVVFFNFSWGPVMWVMLGEMFPNQIRGSALAVAGFAQWMANFAITVSFPALAAPSGSRDLQLLCADALSSRSSSCTGWSTRPAAGSWSRWKDDR